MSRVRVANFELPVDGYGAGEHMFAGMDLPELGFTVSKIVAGENASHVFIQKN